MASAGVEYASAGLDAFVSSRRVLLQEIRDQHATMHTVSHVSCHA